MSNTETPRPPLPFGSPAEYKKLTDQTLGRDSTEISPERLASVNQLADLLGAELRSELALRGDRGYQTTPQDQSGNDVRGTTRVRSPFVLTCQKWIEQSRYIVAAVNPSEVSWSLAQRGAAQKVRAGEIVHYWFDRRRESFFDEPVLNITFQSGNIMPMRTKPPVRSVVLEGRFVPDPTETTPQVPPGLDNFYEFIELVDEQKILDNGDINLVYIIYNSRVFPSITLAGLFTPAGTSWTDSSSDPNQVSSWSASFTVYDSFPRLDDKAALIKIFEQIGWSRV